MSAIPLTETVKNTLEFLNEIYEIQSQWQWVTFLKFSLNLLKDWAIYVLTFQWIFDFVKYPIFAASGAESIFSDLFHLNSLSTLNFAPFENNEDSSSFFSGFFNCFFLYLPLSPIQLIWLRRVIIDGQWAGRAASIGLVCGNLSLLGFCLFGFRDFINIWFGLEPLSYFLGIWLIFIVIFEMTHRPVKILKKSQKIELLKIGLTNFLLVWTDQSGIYQFFGNLSLSTGVSPLDFSNSNITLYFLGACFGSIFWTFFISFVLLRLGSFFPRITRYRYPYSYWIRGFNNFCLIGCITLTLTSLPFYGFDYLFANPLGFSSQDSIWDATPLPKLKTDTTDMNKGRLGEKSSYGSVDTDLSLFDRGRYGGGPVVEFHIESLNYKEEYAWRSRFDRASSQSLAKSKSGGLLDKYLTAQLGPVEEALKKQRREKKRAQQFQKFQNKNRDFKFFIEDEPNFYTLKTNFIDSNEYLIERFVEDYTAEANKEDEEVPDLLDEKMIHFSAFSEIAKYGFDLFSIFETPELDPLDEELAKEIKQKYSENFVYKFLVNFDISNFLKRQPYKLSSKDEIALFKKRLALGEYYDTLRSYSKLPSSFRSLFCGPKSYSNRIYNQQFQGTLKIVERLFSIHLEKEENIPSLPEINKIEKKKEPNFYFFKEPSVLKFDQPLYKTDFLKKNPLIHEQLMDYLPSLWKDADSIPFLQEGKPLPFFVGWDNEKRKFIVTNRFLTRRKTLTNITVPNGNFRKSFVQTQSLKKPKNSFTFTTWPVSEKAFQTNSLLKRLYSTREDLDLAVSEGEDLFKYAEPLMDEENVIYEKLPNIVQRVELKNPDKIQTSLAPTRGGFVWPGNVALKFQIKDELIKAITPLLKNINFFN
uniref:Ycf1 n=1 Tax=Udotea flabellum TaxID=170437 RepID=A0A386B1U7_9CHLO|nr:hypothetical protein Ycf1 [Udotea flabellum]AYC65627.1 hypothetical protein Ycf1 [Udotea flabellum]